MENGKIHVVLKRSLGSVGYAGGFGSVQGANRSLVTG
jgi:hypothetical protein